MTRLSEELLAIRPLDAEAMAAAQAHLDRLTKPPGSLGRLEELVVWLAGVTGQVTSSVDRRAVVVAAADHGVALARDVSAYPSDVTAQMVANFLHGGAAISVLARAARAEVVVIDAGVATQIPATDPAPGVRHINGHGPAGTGDMMSGPAMTPAEVTNAIGVGIDTAQDLIAHECQVILVGEMGIGNTTAASAIVSAITGRPVRHVTGRGTGIDDAGWERKVAAIEHALDVNQPTPNDPLDVLRRVGGLEVATLVGVIAGAAARRVPVLLDGFITGAAALIVCELQPLLAPRLLASHRSAEPGHAIILERLGLRPLLEMDMRLGEGTGATLAMLLLDAAVRVRDEMATFESAGVAQRAAVTAR